MSGVLPGEPDATVDLNVLGRSVEVGLRAVALGERGDLGKLVVHFVGAPAGVVGGGLGRLDLEEHVGALVFDGLERADRATELHTNLGVLDRHVEAHLSATDLLGGERHGSKVEDGREDVPTAAVGADERGGHTRELELRLLACGVHRGQGGASEAFGVGLDGEETDTGVAASRNEDQVGGGAVEDIALHAVEGPSTVARGGLHRDPTFVPATALLGEGQRGSGFTRRNAGEVGVLGVFITTVEQRVGGEHTAREVRGAQQGAAHFLENDDLLDEAEALAAVFLGDGECLEAHLLGHLVPDGLVVALIGLHLLAHVVLGRLFLEEGAHEVAKLVLFFREGEVHGADHIDPLGEAPTSHAYTAVHHLR